MIDAPKGWAQITLGDVGQWGSGGTPKSDNTSYYGGSIPWIRSGDLPDGPIESHAISITEEGLANSSAKWVPAGSVLIAMYGATIGKLGISTYPVTTNQAVAFCVANRAVESRFLFHGLAAKRQDLIEMGQGGAQPNISQQLLKSVAFSLPPLAEQRRIVAKVDSLTSRSARAYKELDRIPILLDRYKSAVLASAFTGRLTQHWRLKLDREGPGDGQYPQGWTVKELGEIGEIQGGIQVGKKRSGPIELIDVPYLRVANVQRGWLNLNEIKTLGVTEAERDRLLLQAGDILMNEGGDRDKLGRGWVWHAQIPECIHQNHVFRIRLHDKEFPPEYVSHYANENGQQYFIDKGTQTTNLASISKGKVAALPVPIPPTDEAREILRRIQSAFGWLDRIAADQAAASRLLPKLNAAILGKAFRGELVPQDPNDEPAGVLLARIRAERDADDGKSKGPRERSPSGSKEQVMKEKPLPPVERLLKDSKQWPAEGFSFEAIAKRNVMPHDELRDALFELLSGPSPKLKQTFQADAEVMMIQRAQT